MRERKDEILAYLGLLLMTAIIGLSFIFVKFALRHAPPIDLLAHRFTIATLGMAIFYLFFKRERPQILKENLSSLLVLSLFYPVLLFLMQTVGLKLTTASEAGILSATAPIFTLILAYFMLKEKSTVWQNLSVLLSVGGVIYIIYKTGIGEVSSESLKGDFYILLSVFSMAFYFVLGRRLNKKMNALDITFFMTVSACVVFNGVAVSNHLILGTIGEYFIAFKNPLFLWSILYLGILSSFLTSFLTNNALRVIPAAQVSIFNNFSPVITVFAGIIVLGENLFHYHIIGGIMVLAGIVGVNVLKERK